MPITLGDAVLWIRGKSDKLKGDLDQSEKQVTGWAGRIKNTLSESMNYAVGQIMAQGITQLSQGIENMARETINLGMEYARQVEDMARLSGASVEDASRIIQISDDMRLSYEEVSTALKMYAKAQADAGINSQMSIETLARLSDQYLALEPGIQRTNFLLENFGRAGVEMGKLMEQGGEGIREMAAAVDDSLVLDQEKIQRQRDLEVAFDGVSDAIFGVKMRLADVLAPYLERFLVWLTDVGIPKLEEFINSFIALPQPVQMAIIAIAGMIVALAQLGPALLGISGFLGLFKGGAVAAGTAAAGGAAKTGLLASALGGLKALLVAIAAALGTTVAAVVALIALIGILIVVLIKLGPAAANTVSMLVRIFVAGFERIKFEVMNFFINIVAAFARGYQQAREAGKNFVQGIWAGFGEGWDWLLDMISISLDNLIKFIKDKLGMESPSLVFAAEIGEPMALGIGKGFDQTIRRQVRATVEMGTMGLAASAGKAAQVNVGRVEYHGRFSQSEMEYFDRRQEQISSETILTALEGMAA